jgi:hypothetical protein
MTIRKRCTSRGRNGIQCRMRENHNYNCRAKVKEGGVHYWTDVRLGFSGPKLPLKSLGLRERKTHGLRVLL